MKGSDILLSLFIIFIFVLLFFFNFIASGLASIQNNWSSYRCNPLVMPFSSQFGIDPSTNFSYCVQNTQKNMMGYFLLPLNYSLAVMNSIASSFSSSTQNVRKMMYFMRNFITSIIQSLYATFLNIIIEFQKIMVSLMDIMGKIIGVFTTLLYMLDGTIKTMQSAWNGPPGKTLRFVGGMCFHPSAKIKLKDGSKVEIKNINLGDEITNSCRVEGIMKFLNIDKDGSYKSCLYEIPEGVYGENILVTGDHLIWDGEKYNYVKNHPNAKKSKTNSTYLHCLVTSTHQIPICNNLFWDYNDTSEMTKNLN